MAENFFRFSNERIAVFCLTNSGRGKGRQIDNAQSLGNRTKALKGHQRQFIGLALNAAGGRYCLAQSTKGALIVNRQGRARRAAIADQTHGVRTDIQHAQRRIGPQGAKPVQRICEFLCPHARHF